MQVARRVLAAYVVALMLCGCSNKGGQPVSSGSPGGGVQAGSGVPASTGSASGAQASSGSGPAAGASGGAAPGSTTRPSPANPTTDAGQSKITADAGSPPGPGTSGSDAGAAGSSSYFHPKAGTTWDWQLSAVDTSHAVEVYDIDYENPKSTVDALHAKNIHVICYVSVGSWEDYRPDASSFPASVIGNAYPGWPGEKFLDIRSPQVRMLMSARFDTCKSKGFDGLEPDNMDVFEDNSGFPLTAADGFDYAQWLADQAHMRGMAIFQKNTSSLATKLFDSYDGAITEDCFDQGWCDDMKGYVQRDKPVFMAEYTDTGVNFASACSYAKTNKYSAILKDRDLTAMLTTCP